MKTMILTTVIAVITAVTFAQNGIEAVNNQASISPGVKVAMFSKASDHVTVIVMKHPTEKLNLKIRDEEGMVVYEKSLRKPENRKIDFDLRNLPVGSYTFEIAKGRHVLYSNSVSKSSNAIALSN
jgi:hypothetical protein